MKKPGIQLHQVLGIIAIVAVLALTVYIALQRTQLSSEAGATEDPKFINVVNENSTGFTIVWITTKETQGSIIIPDESLTFLEDNESTKTHIVVVTGLDAGKRYEYQIQSGTVFDNNQGANYEAYTSKYDYTSDDKLIFGRILGKDNITPLSEGYITIHAESNGVLTNKIYSKLNDQGGWQLNYTQLMSQSLTQKFGTEDKALVTLSIYSPEISETITRSYDIVLDETLQFTDIFLGEDIPWELPAIEDEDVNIEE